MMTGPPLWQLIQRWEEGRRQGREPTAAEICFDCPDLTAEVERLLPLLRAMPFWPDDAEDGDSHPGTVATVIFKAPTLPVPSRGGGGDTSDTLAPPGYQILEEIGRGGMGVVYKARQMGLDRVVALKMILAQGHASLPERLRFQEEARAAAAIQHPGVVQVYEVGEHNGLPFFALEYCSGGSLADRLLGTPLEAKEAAWLVESLAGAVQAAHDKGIVHRDLKPGNVLLTFSREPTASAATALTKGSRLNECEPKITDFGLAKKLEVAGITRPGELMGTPSYMAPEQAGMEKITPACDVYALGAILYECLTGRPPFRGATILETLEQVRATDPVSVRALAPSTSRDLETICLKCLRKEPELRYPSALALAEDLRRWQNGEPIVARPVGPIERAWKAVRRRPLVWGLVAAAVLAMVSGTVVSLQFAHQANRQAEVAREKEAEANEKAQALREAHEQILQTLAAGLLRPLGHAQAFDRLNDFELRALADLATVPRDFDGVRLLIFEHALQRPETAGQLERRLEPILIAAIGLDAHKRQQLLDGVSRRLADPATPPDARRVSARLAVALDADDPALVAAAYAGLLDAAGRVTDYDTLRLLAADYGRLASRLDGKAARAGATAVAERLAAAINEKSGDDDDLRALAESYLGLEARLDPAKARELSAAVSRRLLAAIPDAREVVNLKALAELLGRLSRHFGQAEADEVSDKLLDYLTTKTGNPEVLEALANLVRQVAEKQDAETRKTAIAATSARLRDRLGEVKEGLELKTLARAFVRLGAGSDAEVSAAAGRVLEALAQAEDAFAREALADAFATLAPRLDRKAAADGAAKALRQVLDAMADGADEFTLEPLARAAARLAGAADAAEARQAAARLAGLMGKSDDPGALEPLAAALAALLGRLDAAAAQGVAAPVVTHVLGLMGKAENGDDRLRLLRTFSPLAGRLGDSAARSARAAAAKCLREGAARTTDPVALAELLDGLRSLEGGAAGRSLSPQAEEAAAKLLGSAAEDPDSAARLARAFTLLAPSVSAGLAREGAASLLHRLLDRRQTLEDDQAVLLRYLSPGQLVNLLKHPCCTGRVRQRVLDQLATSLQVPLRGVWDVTRQDNAALRGVDLLAPAELAGAPSAKGEKR